MLTSSPGISGGVSRQSDLRIKNTTLSLAQKTFHEWVSAYHSVCISYCSHPEAGEIPNSLELSLLAMHRPYHLIHVLQTHPWLQFSPAQLSPDLSSWFLFFFHHLAQMSCPLGFLPCPGWARYPSWECHCLLGFSCLRSPVNCFFPTVFLFSILWSSALYYFLLSTCLPQPSL